MADAIKPKLVFISGNSGVGKSTLTHALAERLAWDSYVERPELNPFLSDYFLDVNRWALHVQLFYLTRHLRDCTQIRERGRPVVRDRSFYEGAEIYVPHLLSEGVLSERECKLYRSLYESVSPTFLVPDLLVYVRGGTELLLDRIGNRDRKNETGAIGAHIEKLNRRYESWIGGFSLCPVLYLEAEHIDFRNSQDGNVVAKLVRERLMEGC